MSVLIQCAKTSRYDAADRLRRGFAAAGYTNATVSMASEEVVVMPSGTRMSFYEAASHLNGLEQSVPVEFVTLPHGVDLPMPSYETDQAAGMDLRAAITGVDHRVLAPGKRIMVPTGFNVAIPKGYEIQVRSRSGLAAKHGVFVLNAPGTIDADYRGEIKVILFNSGDDPFLIARGDRIAQAVLAPVVQARWVEMAALDATDRGEGGFGSTGKA